MGFGGINIWQLLIILVIVLLLFGTKRLRGLGGDLGGAIKGFKKAIKDDKDSEDTEENSEAEAQTQTRADAEKSDSKESEKQNSETKL